MQQLSLAVQLSRSGACGPLVCCSGACTGTAAGQAVGRRCRSMSQRHVWPFRCGAHADSLALLGTLTADRSDQGLSFVPAESCGRFASRLRQVLGQGSPSVVRWCNPASSNLSRSRGNVCTAESTPVRAIGPLRVHAAASGNRWPEALPSASRQLLVLPPRQTGWPALLHLPAAPAAALGAQPLVPRWHAFGCLSFLLILRSAHGHQHGGQHRRGCGRS